MRKIKLVFSLWSPVISWAGTLFYLSSIPNLRVSESNFWDEIIRSSAHFIFYTLGYFLFFRAINFGRQGKNFWLPLALTCLYSLFDEIHQSFVPTRSFQIKDLLVDFGGAVMGYFLIKKGGEKMRKLKWLVLVGIVALVFFGTALVVKAVAFQGNGKANAPDLEKIEFIHWKKSFAKPEAAKAPKPPSCYKFLTPTKIRWTVLPVNYVINPINPQGLLEDFVGNAVWASAETWDAATTKELMNNAYTWDSSVTYGVQDYKNAVTFGNYSQTGVIAVTSVWYNPATKKIVEFDVMFDTDWTWGDATVNPQVMDLQNIATHELGHGVGLGDVYETACSEVTMYGYSDYGETKKRTLEAPDIKGLLTLYP